MPKEMPEGEIRVPPRARDISEADIPGWQRAIDAEQAAVRVAVWFVVNIACLFVGIALGALLDQTLWPGPFNWAVSFSWLLFLFWSVWVLALPLAYALARPSIGWYGTVIMSLVGLSVQAFIIPVNSSLSR